MSGIANGYGQNGRLILWYNVEQRFMRKSESTTNDAVDANKERTRKIVQSWDVQSAELTMQIGTGIDYKCPS